jgi:hypothetical protein
MDVTIFKLVPKNKNKKKHYSFTYLFHTSLCLCPCLSIGFTVMRSVGGTAA